MRLKHDPGEGKTIHENFGTPSSVIVYGCPQELDLRRIEDGYDDSIQPMYDPITVATAQKHDLFFVLQPNDKCQKPQNRVIQKRASLVEALSNSIFPSCSEMAANCADNELNYSASLLLATLLLLTL
uniref:ZP domain-containing protein n=1 Tax=Syphacia muris TaxID=451379 RepID=A0A0N5APJ8_9BILA